MTVLIAEDDAFLRQVYRKELEGAGYRVLAVENGEKALKMMRTEKPILILLDLLMPGQDGFDVLTAMRDDPSLSGIPAVVLTNIQQQVDIERAKALGAKEFLNKGEVQVGDLTKIVQKFAKA